MTLQVDTGSSLQGQPRDSPQHQGPVPAPGPQNIQILTETFPVATATPRPRSYCAQQHRTDGNTYPGQ